MYFFSKIVRSLSSQAGRVAVASILLGLLLSSTASRAADPPTTRPTIQLKAYGVPNTYGMLLTDETDRRVIAAFRKQYPWIDPVSATGLVIPGNGRTMDM